MSDNFIQEGKQANFVAGADYSSGDLVNIGSGVFGIVENTVASGSTGVANLEGVFEVPKDSSTFSAIGVTSGLYVVDATKVLSTSTSSATAIVNAMIWEAAAAGAATVKIKLS